MITFDSILKRYGAEMCRVCNELAPPSPVYVIIGKNSIGYKHSEMRSEVEMVSGRRKGGRGVVTFWYECWRRQDRFLDTKSFYEHEFRFANTLWS